MASYENAAAITETIQAAEAAGGISSATAAAITALVEELNNTGSVVAVEQVDSNITSADAAQIDAPIVLMAENTNIQATFDDTSAVKAIVVGGAGNSNVAFTTSDDVTVQLQGGTGDSVATGAGDDAITFTGGSATINTGEGDDQVILQGGTDGGSATVEGGSGDMVVQIEVDLATDGVNATIDAGDGFDQVTLAQPKAGHFFEVVGNGIFKLVSRALSGHDDGIAARAASEAGGVTMENVNVVTFTNGGEDSIQDIAILADNKAQAMVGKLYAVALGREAIDFAEDGYKGDTELTGLNFWLDQAAAEGTDLDHLYQSLVNCEEFDNLYGKLNDQDFANAMFANLGKIAGSTITSVDGMTAADYAAQIASGAMTRADAAIQIAGSEQASDLLGVDGAQYVIEGYTA